jgi:hypothetical protein
MSSNICYNEFIEINIQWNNNVKILLVLPKWKNFSLPLRSKVKGIKLNPRLKTCNIILLNKSHQGCY